MEIENKNEEKIQNKEENNNKEITENHEKKEVIKLPLLILKEKEPEKKDEPIDNILLNKKRDREPGEEEEKEKGDKKDEKEDEDEKTEKLKIKLIEKENNDNENKEIALDENIENNMPKLNEKNEIKNNENNNKKLKLDENVKKDDLNNNMIIEEKHEEKKEKIEENKLEEKKEAKMEEIKEDNNEKPKEIKKEEIKLEEKKEEIKETIPVKVSEEKKEEAKIEEKKVEKETININKLNADSIANNNTTQNAEKNNINEQAKPEQETHQLKRKITFKEAQQQIKDFKIVLEDIEKKIKNKYGDCLPDFSYEEHLPVTLKTKLITSFFESEEIKNIINKVNQEQKSSN